MMYQLPGDPPIWTTSKGQQLFVDQMDGRHIRNARAKMQAVLDGTEALGEFDFGDEDALDVARAWVKVFDDELDKRRRGPETTQPHLVDLSKAGSHHKKRNKWG